MSFVKTPVFKRSTNKISSAIAQSNCLLFLACALSFSCGWLQLGQISALELICSLHTLHLINLAII